MLSRTDLRIDECYNKIKTDGTEEYLGAYKGQRSIGNFQSLYFLNGNKTHMENINLRNKTKFEAVECDKMSIKNTQNNYSNRKSTARRFLQLNPATPDYFTHRMDIGDDKLGGRSKNKKSRKNQKSRKSKCRKLRYF